MPGTDTLSAHPIPLLHMVQAAAGSTAVDPTILVPAAGAGMAVMFWLLLPRPVTVRRLVSQPMIRGTAAMLMFLAVLPSVLPFDHLLPGSHDDNTPAAAAVHSTHCHGSPGSCADAPLAAGPGQLFHADPIVVAPTMLAVLIALATPALRGITLRPDTRPPRAGGHATV